MSEERLEVGVQCGQCGSEDIYMLACPDHEWAVGSICHGCLTAHIIGDGRCRECEFPMSKEGEANE